MSHPAAEISSTDFFHGSFSVGGTKAALTALPAFCRRGVTVKAASGNTGTVYVGKSTVTAGVAAATTDGFALNANEEVFIEASDPTQIYVIGSASGQAGSWIGS